MSMSIRSCDSSSTSGSSNDATSADRFNAAVARFNAAAGTNAPSSNSGTQNSAADPSTDSDQARLLQRLITHLERQESSPATSAQDQALIKQLLPLLQSKLDSLGGSPSANAGDNETALLQQLIAAFEPGSTANQNLGATPAGANPSGPQSDNPAQGISSNEIAAMLAYANGTGPEVNLA